MDDSAELREAAHDPEAFQMLYTHYFQRVYAYVAARVGNTHDVEDIVSDIFLKMLRHVRDIQSQQPHSFAAWLFVTARNTVTDFYRRNGRSTPMIRLEAAAPLATDEHEPESVAGKHETAAQLRALILTLPERKREIVTLKYYGGLRNHEIALVLGIGEKTVSGYLSRALADLQTQYSVSLSPDE